MPSNRQYKDLLRANSYLQKAANSFYFQCTTRTVQESKLFPVNPYIALSYLDAWYKWPTLLRKIDAAMPAEEIGDRARLVGTYANTISMGLIPEFYLGGRQILLDMGLLRPTDAIDDIMDVLDFGERLNLAFHRAGGHVIPSDQNHRDKVHTARQTKAIEDSLIGCEKGDRLQVAYNRFMAAMSAYGFLSHCECRLSFANHGPYRTSSGDEMLVRDAVDLAECDYPWMDGVCAGIPHNNLTIPIVMKDTHFSMVDDWGSFEATPSFETENIKAVGLFTSDWISDGYIPLAMDSASDLADYYDHLREEMEKATGEMWKFMAGWSRDQMVDAGLLVYSGVAKDLAHFAGVYEQDEWFKVEERVDAFRPIYSDEYGGQLIAEIVGLVSLQSQHESPHHMAKYSDQRSEMWTRLPYSVLEDDDWTSTVGPMRIGSTALPEKTAKYTTTQGKLTQDEVNAAAKAMRPRAFDLRRYDDDVWAKHHPDDPRAAELEALTFASPAAATTG